LLVCRLGHGQQTPCPADFLLSWARALRKIYIEWVQKNVATRKAKKKVKQIKKQIDKIKKYLEKIIISKQVENILK